MSTGVRVSIETRDRLQKLCTKLRVLGWQTYGIESDRVPTVDAVVGAALDAFEAAARTRRGKRR